LEEGYERVREYGERSLE
jgi:ElaB/YqjD/DUF883 family membrane-anchored ribosome-binding protein